MTDESTPARAFADFRRLIAIVAAVALTISLATAVMMTAPAAAAASSVMTSPQAVPASQDSAGDWGDLNPGGTRISNAPADAALSVYLGFPSPELAVDAATTALINQSRTGGPEDFERPLLGSASPMLHDVATRAHHREPNAATVQFTATGLPGGTETGLFVGVVNAAGPGLSSDRFSVSTPGAAFDDSHAIQVFAGGGSTHFIVDVLGCFKPSGVGVPSADPANDQNGVPRLVDCSTIWVWGRFSTPWVVLSGGVGLGRGCAGRCGGRRVGCCGGCRCG